MRHSWPRLQTTAALVTPPFKPQTASLAQRARPDSWRDVVRTQTAAVQNPLPPLPKSRSERRLPPDELAFGSDAERSPAGLELRPLPPPVSAARALPQRSARARVRAASDTETDAAAVQLQLAAHAPRVRACMHARCTAQRSRTA